MTSLKGHLDYWSSRTHSLEEIILCITKAGQIIVNDEWRYYQRLDNIDYGQYTVFDFKNCKMSPERQTNHIQGG